jgi:hypothetical protein
MRKETYSVGLLATDLIGTSSLVTRMSKLCHGERQQELTQNFLRSLNSINYSQKFCSSRVSNKAPQLSQLSYLSLGMRRYLNQQLFSLSPSLS